jgi:hypothetical protein
METMGLRKNNIREIGQRKAGADTLTERGAPDEKTPPQRRDGERGSRTRRAARLAGLNSAAPPSRPPRKAPRDGIAAAAREPASSAGACVSGAWRRDCRIGAVASSSAAPGSCAAGASRGGRAQGGAPSVKKKPLARSARRAERAASGEAQGSARGGDAQAASGAAGARRAEAATRVPPEALPGPPAPTPLTAPRIPASTRDATRCERSGEVGERGSGLHELPLGAAIASAAARRKGLGGPAAGERKGRGGPDEGGARVALAIDGDTDGAFHAPSARSTRLSIVSSATSSAVLSALSAGGSAASVSSGIAAEAAAAAAAAAAGDEAAAGEEATDGVPPERRMRAPSAEAYNRNATPSYTVS